MNASFITAAADSFGLTVEVEHVPEQGRAFRVYKGAKLIFAGPPPEVDGFLQSYKPGRPTTHQPLDANENGYPD